MIDLRKIALWPVGGGGAPAPILQEKTVTPTAAGLSVDPDEGFDGLSKVNVNGDVNLLPENVKKDVTIFGVEGTLLPATPAAPNFDDPVILIDYDGTVLHSYSVEDFLALEELPALPEHEGLTAKGWNWSLENAKSYVSECGMHIIGAMYRPTDNNTHIFVVIPDNNMSFTVCFRQGYPGDVSVLWGDGSPAETKTDGTGYVSLSHTYENGGKYEIIVTVLNNPSFFRLGQSGSYDLTGESNGNMIRLVEKVYLADGVYVENYSFNYAESLQAVVNVPDIKLHEFDKCYSLKGLVIVDGGADADINDSFEYSGLVVISFPKWSSISYVSSSAFQSNRFLRKICFGRMSINGSLIFYDCPALKKFECTDGLSRGDNMLFSECYSLESIRLTNPANGTLTISNMMFQNCRSLKNVVLPSKTSSLGTSAFAGCSSMHEITIEAVTPPTFGSTCLDAKTLFKIFVPAEAVNTYKAATGWISFADRIFAIPENN